MADATGSCPGASAQRSLVVGTQDIPAKDQLVLRSLLRVMDGQNGLGLRFSETLAECNVVLVPAHWSSRLPPSCVSVHLLPEETPAGMSPHPGLSVRAPLRLSNAGVVLHAAAELLDHGAALLRSSHGLAPLLDTLLRHAMSRERRITVLPFTEGPGLTVNFLEDRYHSPWPVDELLQGRYRLGEPRRASDAEIAALSGQEGRRLRELLWQATHRLGDVAEAGVALSGHYRLLRWPDAQALSRPGLPLLAALLTSRPQTVAQACAASGASAATISWFLKTNLALGIAVTVESVEYPPSVKNPTPVPTPTPLASEPAPSMLGRIRDRLKLW